jgi:hypothetical protein
MSRFIHVRHGGIVAVAPGPVDGDRETTALHVQGFRMANALTEAEVQLTTDEVATLARELLARLPPGQRRELVAPNDAG